MANKFSRTPPKSAEDFLDQAAMSAKSGEDAAPAAQVAVPPAEVEKPVRAAKANKPAVEEEEDESVYKTLTLRLNKKRYKRLKMLSTMSEEPIQVLLTEALDAYLPKKEKSLED